jgi:hypothetical protein
MQTKELHAASERLRHEVEAARAESQRQRARAEIERRRNADVGGLWKLEWDKKD